jgi:hypothetical protein
MKDMMEIEKFPPLEKRRAWLKNQRFPFLP